MLFFHWPRDGKINFRASNPQINFEEAFLRIGKIGKLVLSRVGCPHCRFPFALFCRGPPNEKETFRAATPNFQTPRAEKESAPPPHPPANVHAPGAENINCGASTPTHRLPCAGADVHWKRISLDSSIDLSICWFTFSMSESFFYIFQVSRLREPFLERVLVANTTRTRFKRVLVAIIPCFVG